jgi:putative DNA-invertase from lambdoid prophage Rac
LKAFGYCRVSTDSQAIEGTSLESQRMAIDAYYKGLLQPKGYVFGGHMLEDGVSGKVPLFDRPQGYHLKTMLQKGDALLMAKLDRGFRSVVDLIQTTDILDAWGVKLILLDMGLDCTTDIGRLMIRQMALWAEFERSRIVERITEGKRMKRLQGFCPDQAPYGFKKNKDTRLVPDPVARQLGQFIVAIRDQDEEWQFQDIAAYLNQIKFQGRRNWVTPTVWRNYWLEKKLAYLEQAETVEELEARMAAWDGPASVGGHRARSSGGVLLPIRANLMLGQSPPTRRS